MTPKGRRHSCASEKELLETIGDDIEAKVSLVWDPSHPYMRLPEEWPNAEGAVRKGRQSRLKDDLAVSDDRICWFGMILGGVVVYMLYQGWRHPSNEASGIQQLLYAVGVVLHSVSVGLCLLMFLILGFIPWYQARKRQREWQAGEESMSEESISMWRFETWLETQKAPATKIMMGLVALVGLAQLLGEDRITSAEESTVAAGLLKTSPGSEQWWRVYTAPFLHGNVVHFLMNGAALLYLGKRLEVFAHWPHVPLVFLLSAAIGNEASLRLLGAPAVGASGGLMGWLGFLLTFEFLHSRLVPRKARRRLLAGVALTALIGIVGYRFIDNAAHAGGLFAGALYGLIVFPKSSSVFRPRATKTDVFAGSLAFGLLFLAAGFAITRILAAG